MLNLNTPRIESSNNPSRSSNLVMHIKHLRNEKNINLNIEI